MSSVPVETARTYGGWRKPRSAGVFGMSFLATATMFVGVVTSFLMLTFSPTAMLLVLAITAVLIVPSVIRDRFGRNLYLLVFERLVWFTHRRRTGGRYVSGPLAQFPSGFTSLPGLAARMQCVDVSDALGSPFAVLRHRKGGDHVSAVIEVTPPGAALVDSEQVDRWVSAWGGWLADLADLPGLIGMSVTVETAPDTGARLRHAVEKRVIPDAPELAAAAMAEIVNDFPIGGAAVSTRISLTWKLIRSDGHKQSYDDLVVDIGNRLPSVCRALGSTGAGAARALTATELGAALRVAFDPMSALAVDDLEPADRDSLSFANAGPVAAVEEIDRYEHDGCSSVSWVMSEAPRGHVHSTSLTQLLAPSPDVLRKRVTILYRPHRRDEAAHLVDNDVRTAGFHVSQQKLERARDIAELRSAERAAAEEATGAGLVRFGMIVTATIPGVDPGAVRRVGSLIEPDAQACRLRLRPAYRTQAATFVCGLPLGIVPAEHLNAPERLVGRT